MPYTGLDLGPVGTVVYWLVLILWSLAGAYFLMFIGMPYANRRLQEIGGRVSDVLNARSSMPDEPVAHEEEAVQTEPTFSERVETPEAPRGYSAFEGFRSFAPSGTPTVEDIVKGLARTAQSRDARPIAAPEEPVTPEPVILTERIMPKKNTESNVPAEEPMRERVPESSRGITVDTRGFIAALLEGDREAVFATLRQVVRGGGSIERFLADAVCALDDAYRARIDGSASDPDIARLAARYSTPVLEHVIAALTTAIDSSYSNGMTGAKLALTRALSEIGA